MTAAACELCEEGLGGQGHDRIGGLALCRRCFAGDVRRVAAARGWTLWSEHEELAIRELEIEKSYVYVTRVRITLGESTIEMQCRRATPWQKLLGLFRSRARSGDPLFEGHVRVWTPRPAAVEAFLRGEGVESSVMEVLGNLLSSWVSVRGGTIEVEYAADDPHTEGEIVVRACVLAHHLGRHAVAAPPVDASPVGASVYGAPRRG